MLFVFDGLKQATPEMLMDLFLPMIGIIVIGVIGMYIFSAIVGRVLGVSKEMAFAVSLTALYGFPADYIITNEVIQSLTEDEQEQAALTSHLMPPMLVAGFVTVTIVSVILAGIFKYFIKFVETGRKYEKIKALIMRHAQEMIAFRRDLHQHPELQFEEFRTTEKVAAVLDQLGITYRKTEPTGLIAEIVGGKPGRVVARGRIWMPYLYRN